MFIQIIRGPVRDAELFDRQVDRWVTDLKPGAIGYQGSTWGLADDGTAFLAARFESEEAAKANSARPEQGAWWADTEPAFGDVTFQDCSDVDTILGGASDDAGFVQVIQGRAKDRTAARAMLRDAEGQLADGRPDILGGVMAWHGPAGDFTQIMCFRSEAEARTGESADADGDVDDQYRDMMAVEPTFIDLTDPHFA